MNNETLASFRWARDIWPAIVWGCALGCLGVNALAAQPARNATDLPFLTLAPDVAHSVAARDQPPLRWPVLAKIRLRPGQVRHQPGFAETPVKAAPLLTARENRRKRLPPEQSKKTPVGVTIDLEGGVGTSHTFIGRLQRGAQFKGGHYAVQGHWEQTDGANFDQYEDIFDGSATVKVDLSKHAHVQLESTYFQSAIDLPQAAEQAQHQKSALEVIAGLHLDIVPEATFDAVFSRTAATFTDQDAITTDLTRYAGQLNFKQLWSLKNTLSLTAQSAWDEYQQGDARVAAKYYGKATLLNAFALLDTVVLEGGVEFDYYLANADDVAEYLVAPVFLTRFLLFPRTTFYFTYHPSFVNPDFMA